MGGAGNGIRRLALAAPKPHPPQGEGLPKEGELLFGASCEPWQSLRLQTTDHESYKLRACFCLPHRGRWPQAGGGLFVGGWRVGGGWVVPGTRGAMYCGVSTSYRPQATSRFPNPHPGPPQRGGRFALLQTAGRRRRVVLKPRITSDET